MSVRRREFITLLGGAVAWPFVTRAQQIRRVGVLIALPEGDPELHVTAGRRNLIAMYRWTLVG
jgi:hypothetical protein